MSKDYTTIRVEKGAKEAAEDARGDSETWSDYLRRCAENPPPVREFVDLADVRGGGDGTRKVTLEASERRKLAEEIAGELR